MEQVVVTRSIDHWLAVVWEQKPSGDQPQAVAE